MFDEWGDLGDAALLASMSTALRTERTATARRVIGAGLFAIRRDAAPDAETAQWVVDDWDVAAAEVTAELGISGHRSRTDMTLGVCLVRRLPRLADRFLAGDVDLRVIATIDERTVLIQDPDIIAALDDRVAAAAPFWNALSKAKLTEVLDWVVMELDPDARRVARKRRDERHITFHPDQHGMSDVVGRLPAERAAWLNRRLTDVAGTVCPEDPRTFDQRRADALLALADGQVRLTCECAAEECAAGGSATEPGQVVIYVLAERATLDGTSDRPAYLPGHGPLPAETARRMAAAPRAKVRPVPKADEVQAESAYRPSQGLSAFLFSRDLICRWPGCSRPAQNCDNDHTVPWPYGSTHPSNLKHFCRHHHLMKTFWGGPHGWRDEQQPDGTVVFTSPSGRTCASAPLGAWFFPQLAEPTATAHSSPVPPAHSGRLVKVPRRRRTRANERHHRITDERQVNVVERLANPPPF